jgi:hypothetical protein
MLRFLFSPFSSQWRNATAGGPPSIGHFWPPFAPLKIGRIYDLCLHNSNPHLHNIWLQNGLQAITLLILYLQRILNTNNICILLTIYQNPYQYEVRTGKPDLHKKSSDSRVNLILLTTFVNMARVHSHCGTVLL